MAFPLTIYVTYTKSLACTDRESNNFPKNSVNEFRFSARNNSKKELTVSIELVKKMAMQMKLT